MLVLSPGRARQLLPADPGRQPLASALVQELPGLEVSLGQLICPLLLPPGATQGFPDGTLPHA